MQKWPNEAAKNIIYGCCSNCHRQGVITGNIRIDPISSNFFCIDCYEKCVPFHYDLETMPHYGGYLSSMAGEGIEK